MLRKTIIGAAAATFMAVAAPFTHAGHIPGVAFTPGPFTVNPGAVGEPNAPFSAVFINFNYQAEADQVGNGLPGPLGAGVFDETGAASFTAFSNNLFGAAIPATTSGLNANYNLYALFTATGTVQNNLAGGIDGTFTSFNVAVFVDPAMDTTFNNVTPGIAGGDESRMVTGGGGEDVSVLTGTLVIGGFHIFTGLANGDFDVTFTITSCGAAPGFFCGPGGLGVGDLGDINGVNTSVRADPPFVLGAGDTRIDIVIDGSGNVSFLQVPEPGSLGLLGLAMTFLGFGLRRRVSRLA